MIIGIKLSPGPGGGIPSVFYCGRNGAEFRKLHAELVAANQDGSRFYSVAHPIMVPLQNVEHSTEDHPEIVAAQKRRAELAAQAEKPEEKPIHIKVEFPAESLPETADEQLGEQLSDQNSELETITPEARRAELSVLKHADLRGIAEGIKNAGRPIALITGTKAQLIEAILASEISTSGSDVPPPALQ